MVIDSSMSILGALCEYLTVRTFNEPYEYGHAIKGTVIYFYDDCVKFVVFVRKLYSTVYLPVRTLIRIRFMFTKSNAVYGIGLIFEIE